MRYIGNKTRLLGEIEAFIRRMGAEGETLFDVFAGTASVGRHFKDRGYRVISNDIMRYSFVLQKAKIAATRWPTFAALRRDPRARSRLPLRAKGGPAALQGVIEVLNQDAPPHEGIVSRQFTPAGPHRRRFFTEENGRKIDGVIRLLRAWRSRGLIRSGEYWLLLAALIEAADRVANISGVYGAFLKRWEPNARRPLRLDPVAVSTKGRGHRVYQEDGNRLARRVEADILYVDPPYNRRQYAANYHVLEVIAEAPEVDDVEAYESRLYSKTGLRPYGDRRSEYCLRQKASGQAFSRCEAAFRDLIRSTRCRHIIISYSEEGILSREAIGRILADETGGERFDFRRAFWKVGYRRFRSDALPGNGRGRAYRQLDGRRRDEVHEWLFYARKGPPT